MDLISLILLDWEIYSIWITYDKSTIETVVNLAVSEKLSHLDLVVLRIVSLTSSLRGQLVKSFTTLLPNTQELFVGNKWEKLLHLLNKSIANDCVILRHCEHFHSSIFSNRFMLSVSTLSRTAKSHGACYKIYVLTRHFITLISYYKLPINHFPLWSSSIFMKSSEKIYLTYDFI